MPSIFGDDFEAFTGWSSANGGSFAQSSAQAHGGTYSGATDSSSTISGGKKSLGVTHTFGAGDVTTAWILMTGGKYTFVAETDGFGNGYAIEGYVAGNKFWLRRLDTYSPTVLASISITVSNTVWYRAVVDWNYAGTGKHRLSVYDTSSTLLGSATMATADTTYASATYIECLGQNGYVDDIDISTAGGGATTISLTTASLSLTANALTPASALSMGAGSIGFTANAAELSFALALGAASISLVGQAITLLGATVISLAAATLNFSPQPVLASITLNLANASISMAGNAVTVTQNRLLQLGVALLNFAGRRITVTAAGVASIFSTLLITWRRRGRR